MLWISFILSANPVVLWHVVEYKEDDETFLLAVRIYYTIYKERKDVISI